MRAQKLAKAIRELSNLNTTKCHLMQYRRAKDKGKKKGRKKNGIKKNMNIKQTNKQFINQK